MKSLKTRTTVDSPASVIRRLREIVGDSYVQEEPRVLKLASNDTSPFTQEPLALVRPLCAEEIVELVKLANQFDLSLWPVSTGRNWGYGGASPARPNCIVVSLERMNRIISVDEELALAIIEPGVTYAQLNKYLKEKGLKLWCDTTDGPPGGSVIGNALERGIGETPYGDHFGNLCGLEVVLPNGESIQTGGGKFQGCKTWNTHKWGVGPYLEGLFSQGNFGIVTRAGIWLMPEPEDFASFTFELASEEDFPTLLDTIRRLSLSGVLQTKLHLVNDIVSLAVVTQCAQEGIRLDRPLSDDERQKMRKKFGLSCWSFAGGIYGPHERLKADRAILLKELSGLGTLRFFTDAQVRQLGQLSNFALKAKDDSKLASLASLFCRKVLGKAPETLEALPHIHSILKGNPSEFFLRHAYFRSSVKKPDLDVNPVKDGCGLIWFAPITPLTADNIDEVLSICKPLFKQYGFDFYVALLLNGQRSMVALMSILYQKDCSEQSSRARHLYFALCAATERAGYQQYRAGVGYMERILDNAPAYRSLVNTIKHSVDPNGILAPGKYGTS
jgi:4-cresol dehydrogenase (hydroxylating)